MTHTPTDALRLVPVEPTEAMQNAGVDAATNLFEGWVDEGQVSTLYRAMLAAAPDMMCCDNCGTMRGKADECDCSLHDGTPPVWVSAAPASPLPGGGDILWMMHVRGPDDIYPAPDYETAVAWCDYVNDVLAKAVPEVVTKAVPAIWTGSPESHADGLPDAIKGWTLPAAPTGEPK